MPYAHFGYLAKSIIHLGLLFLDSGYPLAADSGMTDLFLALKSLVFQQPVSDS
jgi:hypothetical protein